MDNPAKLRTGQEVEYESLDWQTSLLITAYLIVGILVTYFYAIYVLDLPYDNFIGWLRISLLCLWLGSVTILANRLRKSIFEKLMKDNGSIYLTAIKKKPGDEKIHASPVWRRRCAPHLRLRREQRDDEQRTVPSDEPARPAPQRRPAAA